MKLGALYDIEVRYYDTARKVLIVFLSHPDNAKAIAEIIHQMLAGKLAAIEVHRLYGL